MSGICGIFNLDDAPVVDPELRAMTAMLERRGPDRTGAWRNGPVGLGHTLLATTPELSIERQPFRHAESDCVIIADVRLDNRAELYDALQMQRPLESIGDAELILNAYLAWGDDCPKRLLGDFAFALWDARAQRLFCARDHFGLRAFYYHHAVGQRFHFASDARAILVSPRVPYRINQGRIADFLVPQLEWIDYTSTFFEDVYRLPPGHSAVVTRDRLVIEEYWKPAPGPELGPMSDDDYREGFLEVFTLATESRLRASAGRFGSMLSGGMDSGSVVVVAKDVLGSSGAGPLKTLSATRQQDDDCAESRAIRAAIAMPLLSPTLVYLENIAGQFELLTTGNAEPFDGEATILKAIYLAAHTEGLNVLLDGAGGDVVLSEGSYIARLLRRGHFNRALREIAGENRFWGGGMLVRNALKYVQTAFVPEFAKQRFNGARHRRRVSDYLESSLVSREFALAVDIEERFARMRQMSPRGWEDDYAVERCNVIRPSVTAGRERYARLAAGMAIEARDPFLDKRVVDFCSRLPGRFRLRDGWPKAILRDLMAGKLPEEVLWGQGKPHLGWQFNAAITIEASKRGVLSVAGLQDSLMDYVDPAKLDEAWQSFHGSGDAEPIHSAYTLSVWLRENEARPVVPD
jgi:asparagine synthase (glutamine-hydrolysing)